ncbi:MAG: hypothetical protein GY796_00785 [Chloroflexi bacterium]|nr:hypothetical protein [Chloroflexota bacterium]
MTNQLHTSHFTLHNSLFIPIFLMLLLAACQEDAPITAVPPTSSLQRDAIGAEPAEEATAVPTIANPTQTPEPTALPTPSATPLPPRDLTVCMVNEPQSLYLYGDDSLATAAVRHAISENLFTTLDYAYQPRAILKLPSLSDGDAIIRTAIVQEGELIVNSAGSVVPLVPGTQIINDEGEYVIYEPGAEREPVQMQQMVVNFAFQPLVWSDGVPFTADDSIFSFAVAADPETPGNKAKIERTDSYNALDDLTVQWTGLPGFLDSTYFTNVWPPLPRHQLADFVAEELLTAELTTQTPLSNGPFVVAEWEMGSHIRLERNPHYYRQGENLPTLDVVTFRFDVDLSMPATTVSSGDCDLVTQDAIRLNTIPTLLEADNIQVSFVPSPVYEHIDFGVDSWQYGDDDSHGRPDWFEFVTVRQAIAQCIDRPQMVAELLYGQGQVMDAYVPVGHPLFPNEAVRWTYDVTAANALLDEFGLEDTDGDGFRELVERNLQQTIVATTTFSITLGTNSESGIRLRLNEMVRDDLAKCGINVNLYDVPAETWYDDGPFSPLFGRRFDLATFAWLTNIRPPCGLYLSTNATGPEEQGFGGWSNVNATGWGNEVYDVACQAALDGLPGTENYEANHQEAIRIFTERLPAVPLFQYGKTAVAAPTVHNFQPNSSQPSELWNLFELDIEDGD